MKKYLWLIALIFLSIGIWQQQYLSVLRKAAMICLECIGIGLTNPHSNPYRISL
ncbi:CD1871A family CXXC motif-containing protein [Phascolarctobacterium faecium]|uniref:CD1871A family CXXC motif-containing protein n=1 Tax=Phascolarctobacterium faecium TaxID=33025 RepID=UPI003AB23B07